MTPAGDGLGEPRVHLRRTDSTNTFARQLAARGAPHGTLVTAGEQLAGRGRQGRAWSAPPGSSLLCSWVIREPAKLLSLAAGAAVAEVCGKRAMLKWPNDVLIDERKVAGVLVEGRPQEHWAVLGIGINVALDPEQLPEELRDRAGTLGRAPSALEPTLECLRTLLEYWLVAPEGEVLEAVRARDALRDRRISWGDRSGVAREIDANGALEVELDGGDRIALDAGEVHLSRL